MTWSPINRNPSPATLRQFALLWLVFFLGLAGWNYFRLDRPLMGAILAVVALSIGLPGSIWPASVRWLFVGSMLLTAPIGWTVAQLLLALLYFGIFTPLAVLFRIIGRDQLLRSRPARDSLWLAKPSPADSHSYFRQS